MMEPMQAGLIITAIGMGLVFAAIVLLWGLMALMVRIGSPSEVLPSEPIENPVAAIQEMPGANLAAVAALAVALALQERTEGSPIKQSNNQDSPWQIIQRARAVQINASLSSIRQNRRS